jgi:hypothetical protein
LGAACLTGSAAAVEYEFYESAIVGASWDVPPGFDEERFSPGETVPAPAVRLSWDDGPYGGLSVLAVRREARYESAAVMAGLFQRRWGASASFEAEAEVLSPAELAAAGADDGVRAAYVLPESEGGRRLDVLFLSAGDVRYRLEVSYPGGSDARLGAAAERILGTFKIIPASEAAAKAPAEAGDATEKTHSE